MADHQTGDEAERALRHQAALETLQNIETALLLEDLEEALLLDGKALGENLEDLFPSKKPVLPKKEYTLKPHLTQKPLRGNPELLKIKKELKRR